MGNYDPLIQYHLQRGDLFYGYDRHGEDVVLWLPFGSPFVCFWDTLEEANRWRSTSEIVRVSVDGVLV